MQTDYFALLGVARTATPDEIKAAYRRLARQLHPNAAGNAGAKERFQEITRAYQVLHDPDQRIRYELDEMQRALELSEHASSNVAPLRELAAPTGSVLPTEADVAPETAAAPQTRLRGLFQRFSSRRAGSGGAPSRGDDHEVAAAITFEEAVLGGKVLLTFAVPERKGSGKRAVERAVEMRVPKGAMEGQRLRLKGMGGPSANGGAAGDLLVALAYRPHHLFRRLREHDLWFYLPIAPWEAVLGAILAIPTLEKPLRAQVPASSNSGQTFRLKGRGLPKPQGRRGDLLACLRVVTPDTPTESERQLYLQLSRVSPFSPRRNLG
jgi:curved DNA-binding protein